ncbi:MAG: hypothetical protein J6H18_03745 [Lachnospiraceae bacterium]|nr:hypothetical protein [Lachnospiraceae bacterium]
MKELFLQIMNLSLSAAIIAGLVMLLRLVLKKSPRFIVCALWTLVAVRLILPALPESPVSMMPRAVSSGTVVEEIASRPVEATIRISKQEPRYLQIIEKNPGIPVQVRGQESFIEVSEKTLESPKTVGSSLLPVLAWIWAAGVGLMLLYMGFSYLRIWRKVLISVREGGRVYLCDGIDTPFILGLARPRIYLPSRLEEKNKAYVLAHEQAHIKRGDFIWKPLGYLLLALHWFNPVMWAAYILLCRDIEMACDEKVTGREGSAFRKAYSQALLACSSPARLVTACPLAFGEVGVKTRIRSVLNYKKPAFWILILTLLACTVAAGCALTNRGGSTADPTSPGSLTPPASETQPSSEAPSQEPHSETLPTESREETPTTSTEPSSENPGSQGEAEGSRISLKADQEGVLTAPLVAFWPIDSWQAEPYYEGEGGPQSFFIYDGIGYGTGLLLDSVNKRLLASDGGEIPLNFTNTPLGLSALQLTVEGFKKQLCLAVVDQENIYLLSASAFYPLLDTLALPELGSGQGRLPGEDVLTVTTTRLPGMDSSEPDVLLVKSRKGDFAQRYGTSEWVQLEETAPYFPGEKEGTVCLRTPQGLWLIEADSRDVRGIPVSNPAKDTASSAIAFVVVAEDQKSATLYEYSGETLYTSRIDMQDWLYVPRNFILRQGGEYYVMAPREGGVEAYCLEAGIHRLRTAGTLEDVSGSRASILEGEVLALNNGRPVSASYRGFKIGLNDFGLIIPITLEDGVGNHQALAYELYADGQPAGTSWLRYHWSELGLGEMDVLWPEGGTFSREAGYRMYLASLDGKTITLFLESDEQTYGLDLIRYGDSKGLHSYFSTRIRGVGKTMADFRPNQPLESYIAEGWQLRPAEGDQLDLDGDGGKDLLMVIQEGDGKAWPFAEWIITELVDQKPTQAEEPVSYLGTQNAFADERGCNFRYGDLYYAAREEGGYDLIGELSINGRTIVQRYQLTDENRSPLQQGDDFTHAAYRNVGGYPRPLPGWEGMGDSVQQYYDWKRAGNAPVSARDLAQLQHLFRGLFAGHFLLSEYENVVELDPDTLFYDGVEESPVPSVTQMDPEEQKEVLAQIGDSFGLPLFKLSRPAAEEAFLRYTGQPLSALKNPIHFTYVEKYDAWYIQKGDTANRGYSIVDAYTHVDGSVTALWRGLGWEKDDFGLVLLKKYQDSWRILANRFISDEELESLVSRGQMRAPGTRVLVYDAGSPSGL